MNYNLEIQKILLKIDQQSQIEDKITLLKQAISLADANNDLDWGYDLRLEILHWEGFLGKSTESIIAFTWLLNICDSEPDQFEYKEILKRYKWMIFASFDYLLISKEQLDMMMKDYSNRLAQNGYSARSYYEIEANWSLFTGDVSRARKYLAFRDLETFDEMCIDDEMITDICVELLDGNIDKGIAFANEFLGQKPDQKGTTYSLIVYYLALNKDRRVSDYFEQTEQLLSNVNKYPYMIFDISQLMYYLSKNEKEKAWKYYELYAHWEVDVNEYYSFDFSLSVLPLFSSEETKTLNLSSKLPFFNEKGIYNTSDLYKYYVEKVNNLGSKFDQRNGNTYFREQITKHLN